MKQANVTTIPAVRASRQISIRRRPVTDTQLLPLACHAATRAADIAYAFSGHPTIWATRAALHAFCPTYAFTDIPARNDRISVALPDVADIVHDAYIAAATSHAARRVGYWEVYHAAYKAARRSIRRLPSMGRGRQGDAYLTDSYDRDAGLQAVIDMLQARPTPLSDNCRGMASTDTAATLRDAVRAKALTPIQYKVLIATAAGIPAATIAERWNRSVRAVQRLKVRAADAAAEYLASVR